MSTDFLVKFEYNVSVKVNCLPYVIFGLDSLSILTQILCPCLPI